VPWARRRSPLNLRVHRAKRIAVLGPIHRPVRLTCRHNMLGAISGFFSPSLTASPCTKPRRFGRLLWLLRERPRSRTARQRMLAVGRELPRDPPTGSCPCIDRRPLNKRTLLLRRPTRFHLAPAAVEFPRKALASNRFSGERFTRRSLVDRIELPFPSRTVGWPVYHSTVHRESESSVDITADAVPEPNRFSPVT